jgi:hypothetical protein
MFVKTEEELGKAVDWPLFLLFHARETAFLD